MALVVIDGNQRVFRSFGETRHGSNVRPQLDSVIRIASITKLMTSEMLVKLLDQGTVKLNDPLSKYAPPGARVPTYRGTPITLVNTATHTSALPREQLCGAANRPVFVWPTREQRWSYLSGAKLKAARVRRLHTLIWHTTCWRMLSQLPPGGLIASCLKRKLPVR